MGQFHRGVARMTKRSARVATGGSGVHAEEERAASNACALCAERAGLHGTAWVDVLLIGAAGIVCYVNSFGMPFVFDGITMVQENQALRQLWPPWPVLSYSMRPVSFFTFALNYAVGGTAVWGYHVVNLAIHVAAAAVLDATGTPNPFGNLVKPEIRPFRPADRPGGGAGLAGPSAADAKRDVCLPAHGIAHGPVLSAHAVLLRACAERLELESRL